MKLLLSLLFFIQVAAWSQPNIKNVIVEGEGDPIVMLAGGTADMSAFAVVSRELSHRYKVIRMEHFNIEYATEGSTLPRKYSVQMESEAIRHTLDSLHINGPVVLIGHSYGGVIAFDYALNYPNSIRSLVLLEPPLFGIAKANHESPAGMKEMLALTKELTPQAPITEEQVKRFRCELLNCDSILIEQHPQWNTWLKQKNRLRGLSAVGKYKINFKKLHQFQKPVLIITGTQTVPFHKRIDALLAKEFRLAQSVTIQSGHAIPATAPKELASILLEFIK